MGTWGVHSFDNDDAVEWAAVYREMGLPVAASTLEVALGDLETSNLSADIACRAIAAAEAVAYVLGRGTDKAAEVFAGAPEADTAAAEVLVSSCNNLIMAVTGGSELDQLWRDANWEDHKLWVEALTDLRGRLNGQVSAAATATLETPETASAEVSGERQLEDIRMAIAGLSADVEVLRQEMSENFARLAKRIEGGVR